MRCQDSTSRPGVIAAAVLVLALRSLAGNDGPAQTLLELQRRLDEHIAQPQYTSAFWGIKVISLETGKTLFEHNAEKLFSPASNTKLYTVAMALERLGPDYRIKTSLYAKGRWRPSGILNGDLAVYGRGDPSITSQLHDGDIFKALAPLVTAVTNAGIKEIKGDLIGDERFFKGPEFGSGWAWDDLEYSYGAEVSALTINDNTLELTVKPGDHPGEQCQLRFSPSTTYLMLSNRSQTVAPGRKRTIKFYRPLEENVVYVTGEIGVDDPGYTEELPFHNPAGLFLRLFKEALARQGIKVTGQLRTINWLERQSKPMESTQMVELGSMESLPISEIAALVLKPSQNLYTDLLLAHVGEVSRNQNSVAEETSEELGIQQLDQFVRETGMGKAEVIFEEGSGLSRDNLTTPNATAALLQYMSRQKCAATFLAALPIAGVDGTLRNRMRGTAAQGNVRAKTGSLRWARSLSGYVTTAAGERLAFSFMLNRFDNSLRSATADLDAMTVLLANFVGRSDR